MEKKSEIQKIRQMICMRFSSSFIIQNFLF